MDMQKKYFKCYFCKTGNLYLVPKETKGKNCRCCFAFNYFFKKNNNRFKKKYYYNNNFNHRRNNNRRNNYQNNNHNINNQNNTIFNNNLTINQTISNIIPNSYNNNSHNNLYLELGFSINNINFAINKKKDINNIKNEWLKKEKMTKEIIEKKKEGCECSICLENIKLNEYIHILKCGHIFHYQCLQELINHNDNKCPNCRCDLKTGEKQKEKQENLNYFNYFDFISIDDDSFIEYDENYIPVFER